VRGVLALAALGGAAATLASCNLVIGADDYAVGPWGCVLEDAGASAPSGNVTLTANAFPYGDPTTLSNESAVIKACELTDTNPLCATPDATATLDGGIATLHVRSGFQGFLYVQPKDMPCSAMAVDAGPFGPSMCEGSVMPGELDCNIEIVVQLSWPIVADTVMPFPVGTYSDYRNAVLCGFGGVDDERGAVWANVQDCFGDPASGVLLQETMAATTPPPVPDQFCFMNGHAVGYPPGESAGLTTSDGACGWSDMPVGNATITATVPGATVSIASMSTLVFPRTLTYVTLKP
jgi:hypothetical protein